MCLGKREMNLALVYYYDYSGWEALRMSGNLAKDFKWIFGANFKFAHPRSVIAQSTQPPS